jgi:nucleoside phosphorylase
MTDFVIVVSSKIEFAAFQKKIKNFKPKTFPDTNWLYHELENDDRNAPSIAITHLTTDDASQDADIADKIVSKLDPKNILLVGMAKGFEDRIKSGDVIIANNVIDISIESNENIKRNIAVNNVDISQKLLSDIKKYNNTYKYRWIQDMEFSRHENRNPEIYIGDLASYYNIIDNANYFTNVLKRKNDYILGIEKQAGNFFSAIRKAGSKAEFLVFVSVNELININRINESVKDTDIQGEWRYASDIISSLALGFVNSYTVEIKSNGNKSFKLRNENEIGIGTDLFRHTVNDGAYLKADQYAKAIAEIISNSKGEICFAILGHWGRGKTFLMNLVKNELPKDYESVCFSAWKYRLKPELWIHLYECFREKFNESSFIYSIPRKFRGNLERLGIGPILLLLSLISFSLFPKKPIVLFFFSVFGILGSIIIASIYLKNKLRVKDFLKQYFVAPEHTEKLGLQAIIGEDLKTLLIGWFDGSLLDWKKRLTLGTIYTLFIIATTRLVYALLERGIHTRIIEFISRHVHSTIDALFYQTFNTHFYLFVDEYTNPFLDAYSKILNNYLYPFIEMYLFPIFNMHIDTSHNPLQFILISIPIVGIVIPFWLFKCGKFKKNVLLIIDDLDRMPEKEMLEVVESIKLFIEDEKINKYLKVVMIFEEESLKNGIKKKYGKRPSEGEAKKSNQNNNRVVEENFQKLFIAHLRLPPLKHLECLEFLSNIIKHESPIDAPTHTSKGTEDVGTQETDDFSDSIESGTSEGDRITSDQKNQSQQADKSKNTYDLSLPEKEALMTALEFLGKNKNDGAILGPRSIQSYLFKYKLARKLLSVRNVETDPFLISRLIALNTLEIEQLEKELSGHPFKKVIMIVLNEVL